MFSAHGPSKTSVFTTFLQHFTLLSFNTKIAKTLYFTVFCALKFAKKCIKNCPKTVPEGRLFRPVIFWRISLVFWRFFDSPKIPKKRQNTSSMKDFSENSLFSKLETFKMQKCSEMQARASFFKVTFKKHREGGVGGTASTPGSKLALATLLARHRRIEWASALVPPTPLFFGGVGTWKDVWRTDDWQLMTALFVGSNEELGKAPVKVKRQTKVQAVSFWLIKHL